MAFATGTGTTKSFDSVFQRTENIAGRVKAEAEIVAGLSQSGNLDGKRVVQYFDNLGIARNQLEALVTGVSASQASAYAQVRYNSPAYDVVSEYTAMRDAIDSVLAWISGNIPASLITFDTAQRWVVWQKFTAGQTNTLRSLLSGLISTID